jgi:hypothetical protein
MSSAATSKYFDGCFITPGGYEKFRSHGDGVYSLADGLMARNRHFRTTGDSALDRDLDRALSIVADLFEVTPAFGFYDPSRFSDGPEIRRLNAFATGEATDIPGTRGTVAFGWDLFREEFYEHDRSGLTIVAIVAHEFAHILQGNRGYLPSLRVGVPYKSEIHADFLAGYFLGTRKRKIPSLRFERAGDMYLRQGRHEDGNPVRTHGNSRERIDAAEKGFRLAYVDNKGLDDAVRAALEYVRA